MPREIIEVLRVIRYRGPREWVEETLGRSVKGTKRIAPDCTISAATLDEFPRILEENN